MSHYSSARPDWRYCTLARNSAASEGGALLSRYNAFVDLRNCTLVENNAELGAAVDRIYVYAHLQRDEDTRDASAQEMTERASGRGTRVAEHGR